MNEVTGVVFDIQHYSIHDGPGIRTNVFVKGCPLRCLWCQNPESQARQAQLMVRHDSCVGCGACVAACPRGAVRLEEGKARTDRQLCESCGDCVAVCAADAREITGRVMTVEEVYAEAEQDRLFYEGSGGGVTLTGGEVLAQPDFAAAVLARCQEGGLHTAIETCGYGSWDHLARLLDHTDIVLYDVKHMDSEAHRRGTGVGNERILENLSRLSRERALPVIVRTPVIPGFNDTIANMEAMVDFIKKEVPTCQEVNLLPYHPLGESKREQLETEGTRFRRPEEDEMEALREVFRTAGIEVK
ncbi:MAG: glycyl-radical enzyme activating protein [Lachnospiraceae bacterium]|nr:glycyl-radical enzyme activating protein [Lachnospiraceae bacterium]